MADETEKKEGNGEAPEAAAAAVAPRLQILTQYVKDLSFENPGMGAQVDRPQIDLNVDLQARHDPKSNQYEVVLKLRATATHESKTLFILELAYGGIFAIHNVPQDSIQPILLIECPRLLFPFARRIVADVVRDGGLPPLMVEPIDFAALYRNKMNELAGQQPAATT